jgi:ribosomal protein S18 acetylase RimI-like enzyme
MQLTYQELFPEQDFSHLAQTVEQYFSQETPLWWVEFLGKRQEARDEGQEEESTPSLLTPQRQFPGAGEPPHGTGSSSPLKVACLWVGNAIDQVRSDRHAHIFLLYVKPEHRRQGIGTALMHRVENWAAARGDRQISLQVFESNTAALNLYHRLGYIPQSLWLVKQVRS